MPLHSRTFDLDEQLEHLLAFVDKAPGPLALVGHSIGATLALRVLAARPSRIAAVVGLYPFLWNNAQSWLQRAIAFAVRLRPLVWLVARLAALLAALPSRLRRAALLPICRAAGLDDDAVAVSCDWLRPWSVLNTCELGRSEFDALAAPPDFATMRQHAARIALYYGPKDDIWAPPHHYAEVRQKAPAMKVVTDAVCGHMFCVTSPGSQHVARVTAGLLRDLGVPNLVTKAS